MLFFILLHRCSINRTPACLAPKVNFHASAKRDEESKPVEPVPSKGGLFGTGLSEWFALPIGMTLAVPALKLDWYVVNEETQLAAVFVAFCVAFYTQGGDALYKALDERAQNLMKEHNEAEDKVIAALEQKLDFQHRQQLDVCVCCFANQGHVPRLCTNVDADFANMAPRLEFRPGIFGCRCACA